jgi:hypothetical protein
MGRKRVTAWRAGRLASAACGLPHLLVSLCHIQNWSAAMNNIMRDYYPTFQEYQQLRDKMLAILSDEDLAFRPSDANPTLGALCREIGEIEHAYIESFRTFALDLSYRNAEAGLESSVERLKGWLAKLDQELRAAVEGLSEDDIQNRLVDRGSFQLPPRIQLNVYQEALLIFYGKSSVYLRVLGKQFPDQWRDWIG